MLLKILAVVVLAVVGWAYFGHGAGSAAAEEASPNFEKNKHANPATPAPFSARDIDRARTDAARDAAMRGDAIPGIANPSPAFVDAVRKGQVTFYAVRIFDNCAEDGDVVTMRIPLGAEVGPIPLTIAGATYSIPVVAGQPAQVSILGVKDGVGGITLGVQTSGGVWYSTVMQPGESETMPLNLM